MRSALIALTGLLAFTASTPVRAQSTAARPDTAAAPSATDTVVRRLPRWRAGVAADIGQPVGDFKQHVKNAVGGQGHVLLRLDTRGVASLRLQGGWLNYGSEGQRSCLGTAPHCRVNVNLTTANGIFSLAIGPQLALPLGAVRAYGYGLVGMSRFMTVSGLNAGLIPDITAATENFGDGGAMWRGGVGLQLPLDARTSVDIGVGYEQHGTRRYLLEGGLADRPDGSLGYTITRSRASLYSVRLGVTTALGRKLRQGAATP
ncbi:MAG: hypothetical protein LCH84_07715 [Gemmatimonadetes bacterium]|nr:hypothetical protein [Gemmatimonadota bacterium]